MSKTSKTRKKWLIWTIAIASSLLLLHLIVDSVFNIHYSGTFSTKYIKKGATQTIITKQFEIETPGNWWHIFHGYGIEGEAYGYFVAPSGEMVDYEYGTFANSFSLDLISICERDLMTVGRFEVYISKTCDGKTGIYIPSQHEMELPLSLFIQDGNDETLSTILAGIEGMKFKQFYFFWPELDDAIAYFKEAWSEEELQSFKNKPEKEAVGKLHHSVGRWIRNNWLRNSADSSLVKFFYSVGVYEYDEMSSIVLSSLHRSLNNKTIDLFRQLPHLDEPCFKIVECSDMRLKAALLNFKTFNVGDQVRIFMYVSLSEGEKNAVINDCPDEEWDFVPERDLLIEGIIVDKLDLRNDPFFKEPFLLKVQLLSVNQKDVRVLNEVIQTGDTIKLPLVGLRVEALD